MVRAANCKGYSSNGIRLAVTSHVTMAAITVTTIQVPYRDVKSLHFIWRLDTSGFKWVAKSWPRGRAPSLSLSSRFWYSDRYKILHMARQLCCRGMYKNLLRSDGQQRNYSKAKFASDLNCGQKIVSETGPRTTWWQFYLMNHIITIFIIPKKMR